MKFTISADELKKEPQDVIFDSGMNISVDEIDFKPQQSAITPKSVLAEQTAKMGPGNRFLTGIGGGMYGLGLGATQLGAELGNKAGIVDDSTVSNLRQQGKEHQQLMRSLKQDKPGMGNAASWGEFVGEMAPSMLLPGGAAGKATSKAFTTTSPVLRNALTGAVTGGVGGGTYGAISSLNERQSRAGSTAMGAGLGAVTGGTLGAVGGYAVDKLKQATAPLTERIDMYLRKVAPYSPSKYKSLADLTAAKENRAEGVKNLYKLRDELEVTDKYGEKIKQLPENQFQFLEYIEGGKKKLFEMYDGIRQAAQDKGLMIDNSDVLGKLKSIATDKGYNPKQRAYAERLIKEWTAEGSLDPKAAQSRIAGMNQKLSDYYTTKQVQYADNAKIDKEVLDTLRGSLTKTIENAGETYAPLRKAWGSISELEETAIKAYERELSRGQKADPLNFLAAEQVLYAVAKGNPSYLIPAAGTSMINKASKYFTSPDRSVRKMFEETGKHLKDEVILAPEQAMLRPTQPKVFDQSTGSQIPAYGQGSPRTPLNLQSPQAPSMGNPRTPVTKPPLAKAANRIISEDQGKLNWNSLVDKLRAMGYSDNEIRPFVIENHTLFGDK